MGPQKTTKHRADLSLRNSVQAQITDIPPAVSTVSVTDPTCTLDMHQALKGVNHFCREDKGDKIKGTGT